MLENEKEEKGKGRLLRELGLFVREDWCQSGAKMEWNLSFTGRRAPAGHEITIELLPTDTNLGISANGIDFAVGLTAASSR